MTSEDFVINKGSYRDPKGQVFHAGDEVFRTVNTAGIETYEQFKASKLYNLCLQNHWLPKTQEVDIAHFNTYFKDKRPAYLLKHETIPFISYPYEWSFSLLKQAALFHLKIHLQALKNETTLSDASAYNVQFIGHKPIFIDLLSFVPHQEGQCWFGHRQFCEQFLFPLLMRSTLGVAHNSLFRGNLDGISLEDIAQFLPLRYRLSINMQLHVYLPLYFQRKFEHSSVDNFKTKVNNIQLSTHAHIAMLEKLQRWIEKLEPKKNKNIWGNYENNNSYSHDEERQKRAFVEGFIQKTKPTLLFDLGCNSGEYSKLALDAGAEYVVGFDSCQTSLEKSFQKSVAHKLNFLPLYMDITNPSPDLGWLQQERSGFMQRAKPKAILALALIHHLVIAKNIPLESAISWLVSFAEQGVIEFVPKSSPVMQKMLMAREDIFPNYDQAHFEQCLLKHVSIVEKKQISHDERVLYWFKHDK